LDWHSTLKGNLFGSKDWGIDDATERSCDFL
jgi:hypothetical protein